MSYFVICMQTEKSAKYLGYDNASGGYPYWTGSLRDAYLFTDSEKDKEKIKHEINEITKGKPMKMSNGKLYPNPMLHSGLGLNNNNLSSSGFVSVLKLSFSNIETHAVSASIPAS